MNLKFTWSTTSRGEKAVRHNDYLYQFKRENQDGSLTYVCTFKWCSRTICIRDNLIFKSNGGNHNHAPKLSENVQTVLCGLKRRILSEPDQPVTKVYDEEVKRFVSVCSFHSHSYIITSLLFSVVKMVQQVKFQSLIKPVN